MSPNRHGNTAEKIPQSYERGIQAARKGMHAEAIAAFQLAIEEVPGHAASHADSVQHSPKPVTTSQQSSR